MRIAIVGSRGYPRLDDVREYVATLPQDTVVVSGGARGVDRTATVAASARGLATQEYPANWAVHGRAAGYLRNHDIVASAEKVVAFWDGKSKGTLHTITIARERGLDVDVRIYEPRSLTRL